MTVTSCPGIRPRTTAPAVRSSKRVTGSFLAGLHATNPLAGSPEGSYVQTTRIRARCPRDSPPVGALGTLASSRRPGRTAPSHPPVRGQASRRRNANPILPWLLLGDSTQFSEVSAPPAHPGGLLFR